MTEGLSSTADRRRPLWGCLKFTMMALGFFSIILNAVLLSQYLFSSERFSSTEEAKFVSSLEEKQASFSHQAQPKHGNNTLMMHGPLGFKPDGNPAHVPAPAPPSDLNMSLELARGGGFNLKLSDHLPLDRDIPDSRQPACMSITYDISTLPAASVLMVFYNEPFSTLMRSVHSVLNRTHPSLLQEIVLLDDGSDLADVAANGNGKLENYVKLLPKVRLVRSPKREGIVGARMRAIRASQADIFVVLDSHIEVQNQWLEPLVSRIREDPRRIVMPQVDGIDAENFRHIAGGIGCKLGFLWQLMEHSYEFHQMARLPPEQQNSQATDFQTSPTMAGGLFAADKKFFFSIGAYDEGFRYWGTENLEFSFRLWQCGGILECAPCSRVYHIFRKGGSGYSFPSDALIANKMRTLMWMDEYADLAWRVLGKPAVDYGEESLKKRREWRAQKQCKSFKWYMENVFSEADVVHLTDVPFLGRLKHNATGLCLDAGGQSFPGGHPALVRCEESHPSQDFMYFRKIGHVMPVRNDEACLTPKGNFDWCRATDVMWWDFEGGMLQNRSAGECLTVVRSKLTLVQCDPTTALQVRTPTDIPWR
ncbi:inactive polypeptide N-acetylgalactosaminyltransferase-like protein 5 [Cyclospora cayetanensis]|uniref:UDP-n-acetyl-d-galactosamine:polypeptide n-acetylgalactosaminyltransferase n=2 Tax=Cyclospora cayetanensis TaxID=88456 RepID=A0A1D3D1M0_9EIME|nr:inactive polypeptide N-acetylgalactosaminyltransferase-like protein 5 [Cyclospora cayetanensis]OEH77341.1 UDP-n-acetyl-d-galactosamine:polypeptide n-acetylgalactosaminyltransferase [Cyclospora cayetanensis]